MDLKRVLSFPPYPGDYLHPVVYACTAVMLLCLLVSIMTYIVHYSVIRISRNGWHTLLNFLFHTGLTFGVFAGGINQINVPFLCRIVGIILQYASLSTMFWLTFTARNICNNVSKDPLKAPGSNSPVLAESKTTILRFYIVSNGIPLIIVGITAAFGMENYGSRDDAPYCWMAWEPSLGGFYAPVSLLVLVTFVYFLCTYIHLKRHPERKYELRVLSEEQQQLSSTDRPDIGGASGSAGDCAAFITGVSELSNEQSFKSQLWTTVFTLFLFLSTWALGALAVSLGRFLDMIFSCLYGAFCVTLGLFLLIQHCAKRDDVWHHWWACCTAKSKTDDGDGKRPSQRQELHQPQCHLNSICSGKKLLLSPQVVQSLTYKNASPSQNLSPSHVTSCCVAETVTTPVSPLSESAPSPRPLALSDELPRPSLPLPSCRFDRTKSCSFNHPRPCLRDYRSHVASNSTDGSVNSSQLEVPHAAHYLESSPVSNSPHPDLQISCSSPHLDQQRASCHVQPSCHNIHNSLTFSHSLILPSHRVNTCQWNLYSSADHFSTTSCPEKPDACNLLYPQALDTSSYMSEIPEKDKETRCAEMEPKLFPRNTLPRQHATINRRVTFGRNRSLQEDSLFVSDTTGNIRTGPWKNETTV
ncbi:adhesion G protein-coupled receptor A1 isoform X2 [Phyllopteryx taeniolatus]|uniref:adhesion G protein-coupled receptor A1 isoform X2 n=1 Tax=Phyllopteryx taeniolatus TaxID=161469 RepID=UPI002AD48491|nr:adhesion G protein-coupled receptor A1 isoform X2 [Phyllopteryx taeniolatus]